MLSMLSFLKRVTKEIERLSRASVDQWELVIPKLICQRVSLIVLCLVAVEEIEGRVGEDSVESRRDRMMCRDWGGRDKRLGILEFSMIVTPLHLLTRKFQRDRLILHTGLDYSTSILPLDQQTRKRNKAQFCPQKKMWNVLGGGKVIWTVEMVVEPVPIFKMRRETQRRRMTKICRAKEMKGKGEVIFESTIHSHCEVVDNVLK
jgi:hypothetical protein